MAESWRFETVAGHPITRLIIAIGAGFALALYAFQFSIDPGTVEQRAEEEAAVRAARNILRSYVEGDSPLQIADPLAPNRALGKAFVYPEGDGEDAGFEVSGYYRRGEGDTWHPFLMRLDGGSQLVSLSVRDSDPTLRRRAAEDPRLVVQ